MRNSMTVQSQSDHDRPPEDVCTRSDGMKAGGRGGGRMAAAAAPATKSVIVTQFQVVSLMKNTVVMGMKNAE